MAAAPLIASAYTDSAKIVFRLDFLLGVTVSSCLSVVSAWIWVSDVFVTALASNDCIKKSRRWIVRATAPYALPTKTGIDYGLIRLIPGYRRSLLAFVASLLRLRVCPCQSPTSEAL